MEIDRTQTLPCRLTIQWRKGTHQQEGEKIALGLKDAESLGQDSRGHEL